MLEWIPKRIHRAQDLITKLQLSKKSAPLLLGFEIQRTGHVRAIEVIQTDIYSFKKNALTILEHKNRFRGQTISLNKHDLRVFDVMEYITEQNDIKRLVVKRKAVRTFHQSELQTGALPVC